MALQEVSTKSKPKHKSLSNSAKEEWQTYGMGLFASITLFLVPGSELDSQYDLNNIDVWSKDKETVLLHGYNNIFDIEMYNHCVQNWVSN